ncbi:MAG: hypothetical protein HQL73_06570 [Magnetococcales bacterium]|nr:hypothetical protein [Magnetococcales bacterium]
MKKQYIATAVLVIVSLVYFLGIHAEEPRSALSAATTTASSLPAATAPTPAATTPGTATMPLPVSTPKPETSPPVATSPATTPSPQAISTPTSATPLPSSTGTFPATAPTTTLPPPKSSVAPVAPARSATAAPITPATANLGDVSGTYDVHGEEALNKEGYQGIATVTKNGDVYAVLYKDEEATVHGVGLVDGITFSVAYVSEGTPAVLVLKSMSDGTLRGPWAYRGENVPSSELWQRR